MGLLSGPKIGSHLHCLHAGISFKNTIEIKKKNTGHP